VGVTLGVTVAHAAWARTKDARGERASVKTDWGRVRLAGPLDELHRHRVRELATEKDADVHVLVQVQERGTGRARLDTPPAIS
jgi:hypothetical protein